MHYASECEWSWHCYESYISSFLWLVRLPCWFYFLSQSVFLILPLGITFFHFPASPTAYVVILLRRFLSLCYWQNICSNKAHFSANVTAWVFLFPSMSQSVKIMVIFFCWKSYILRSSNFVITSLKTYLFSGVVCGQKPTDIQWSDCISHVQIRRINTFLSTKHSASVCFHRITQPNPKTSFAASLTTILPPTKEFSSHVIRQHNFAIIT